MLTTLAIIVFLLIGVLGAALIADEAIHQRAEGKEPNKALRILALPLSPIPDDVKDELYSTNGTIVSVGAASRRAIARSYNSAQAKYGPAASLLFWLGLAIATAPIWAPLVGGVLGLLLLVISIF